MFWKIFEFFIRLIYFRRFRAAKRIGAAGDLLVEGKPSEALQLLERVGGSLHQSLLPLYAFTRGKILDALDRRTEAEESFRLVALTDPANAKADLELAILCGRDRRFDECTQWLDRADGKEDEEVRKQASGIREILNTITSGDRVRELQDRAAEMAKLPVGPSQSPLGCPPDLDLLEKWIAADPKAVREKFDELAILIGQGEVKKGATWTLSLSLDESRIQHPDGTTLNPFETLHLALKDDAPPLSELTNSNLRSTENTEDNLGTR